MIEFLASVNESLKLSFVLKMSKLPIFGHRDFNKSENLMAVPMADGSKQACASWYFYINFIIWFIDPKRFLFLSLAV